MKFVGKIPDERCIDSFLLLYVTLVYVKSCNVRCSDFISARVLLGVTMEAPSSMLQGYFVLQETVSEGKLSGLPLPICLTAWV